MSEVSRLAMNEEGFIFDPATGEGFLANEVAVVILRALQQGRKEAAVVELLCETYDVAVDRAASDVADFRGRLQALGVK